MFHVEGSAFGKRDILNGYAEFLRYRHHQQLPRPFRRLYGRVAGHQGHAARVAAKIYRRQVRVSGDDAYVERIDSQDFSDDVGKD